MPFPFSFVFSVPGIPNPFTQADSPRSPRSPRAAEDGQDQASVQRTPRKLKRGMGGNLFRANRTDEARRRPPTPNLESTPTGRKRGWIPSSSEPSIPTTVQATVQTSTSGHINPHGAQPTNAMFDPVEQQVEDEMEAGEYSTACMRGSERVEPGGSDGGLGLQWLHRRRPTSAAAKASCGRVWQKKARPMPSAEDS